MRAGVLWCASVSGGPLRSKREESRRWSGDVDAAIRWLSTREAHLQQAREQAGLQNTFFDATTLDNLRRQVAELRERVERRRAGRVPWRRLHELHRLYDDHLLAEAVEWLAPIVDRTLASHPERESFVSAIDHDTLLRDEVVAFCEGRLELFADADAVEDPADAMLDALGDDRVVHVLFKTDDVSGTVKA